MYFLFKLFKLILNFTALKLDPVSVTVLINGSVTHTDYNSAFIRDVVCVFCKTQRDKY